MLIKGPHDSVIIVYIRATHFFSVPSQAVSGAGIILCMHPANERWRHSVTPSLIGCLHAENDPSVHVNHWTCQTYPMARPKCLMRNFTNWNRIYKAHQTNV